ncbi:uncharacterized protein BDZ99DRAFT_514359 [Mytilinidion resinicola]|uniref:Zinc finger RING-type eukaryotic domain-containing protein n=1 Tax=Mytilinidion resinicola TaxID=574789 RepID=A0A6A6Z3Q7_9PEZI|nr:uncharacterized protein BDZ99DRAFT_514359 [Mytilinidion resinicola]KAF2815716.1 hypothetical protein BDZ99DRAFT_514359 [Mytilinidion resinicola]
MEHRRSYHRTLLEARLTFSALRSLEQIRIIEVNKVAESDLHQVVRSLDERATEAELQGDALNSLKMRISGLSALTNYASLYSNCGEDPDAHWWMIETSKAADVLQAIFEQTALVAAETTQTQRRLVHDTIALHPLGAAIEDAAVVENVGPDPDIDELGDLWDGVARTDDAPAAYDSDRGPEIRCAICLERYSEDDPPFRLRKCGHIIGQTCMRLDQFNFQQTTGVIAEAIGATVVVIEHRYWGVSSPFDDLSTENLQYLTLKNSIADLVLFTKIVKLPFDPHGTSQAHRAPWVLAGGSYSGALTAWTASTSPGTFWAYLASSAVVKITGNFWQYFLPVQEGMPKNCSKDMSLIVDHVDKVGTKGTDEEKTALKDMFGLGDVEHFRDFASALENGPWLWQGNQFYRNTGFFDYCDAVENVASGTVPGAEGVGLEKALAGYANYFNETILPGLCAGYGYFEGKDLNIREECTAGSL